MQGRRWAGLPALLLCAIAFGVSYYLFARGVKLATSADAGQDFCSAIFQASCDSTLLSEYSKWLGLSFAAWGAAYYLTLGVLVVLSMLLRDLMHRQVLTAAIVLNAGGLVVSGYLSWLLLSGKVAFCPLCFLTHLLNLGLLPTLMLFRGGGVQSVFADIRAGIEIASGSRPRASTENTARGLALVAALLIGIAATEWFMLRSRPAGAQGSLTEGQLIDNLMQAYFDQDVVEIPVGPDDPREGPADAPLQLVVFSDFECPSCKSNARMLERMTEFFGERLSIVYKHYPLSIECNPNIATNPHKYACGAAYAGIAAHRQGKFVPFHHLLYSVRGAPAPGVVEQVARQVGIDVGRLKQDMQSQAVREMLDKDIQLAADLKILSTPSMFLNGRQLTSATAPHAGLIADQLLQRGAEHAPGD